MRIQVFQHVPFEGVGSLESFFSEAGVHVAYTRYHDGDSPPAPEAFDLLLVMGGPMGVYDEEIHPWLREEKQALQNALDAGKPVLGICLGSQLLAEVLGGVVTRNAHKEIGWWPVESLSDSASSWISGCFPDRFTTFHWHGDTFSIPPGATSLFRSEGCAHQGFVWNDRAVGLQFHPEITPGAIASWLENGDEEVRAGGPYVQTPDQMCGKAEDFSENNGWIAKVCEELIRRV